LTLLQQLLLLLQQLLLLLRARAKGVEVMRCLAGEKL